MINWLRNHWPRLRLRSLLFGIFVFVAGLPGLSAVFLRVYENTLVRQTETELIAQGAALVAAAGGRFPPATKPHLEASKSSFEKMSSYSSRKGREEAWVDPGYYRQESPRIDLNQDRFLTERPDPRRTALVPDDAARMMAEAMQPVIDQTGRTTLASIILIDTKGTILTGRWAGQSYAHVPEVQKALQGRMATVLRRNGEYQARYALEWLSRAATLRVHHARPIVKDGRVVGVLLLSRSSRALFRGMYEDRGKIAFGFFLILGILFLLTALLNRTIARPIVALSRATRAVASGRGGIPDPPATAAIEIRALYEDFADMAQSIARRSRYLKNFAAAVSHEFKTPLAGIRGAVELIEDHGESMSEADLKRFLGNITADTERLSALVSRLLDQARADMARPETGASSDVASVLGRVADAMRSDVFAVLVEGADALPRAAMAEPTLETILIGLAENARQAGAGALTFTASRDGADLVLVAQDDGPGIAPADRERMFEPFFTTRRAEGGTGLGLSIARSLIEGHLGEIDLVPGDSGTAFRIVLPLLRG